MTCVKLDSFIIDTRRRRRMRTTKINTHHNRHVPLHVGCQREVSVQRTRFNWIRHRTRTSPEHGYGKFPLLLLSLAAADSVQPTFKLPGDLHDEILKPQQFPGMTAWQQQWRRQQALVLLIDFTWSRGLSSIICLAMQVRRKWREVGRGRGTSNWITISTTTTGRKCSWGVRGFECGL